MEPDQQEPRQQGVTYLVLPGLPEEWLAVEVRQIRQEAGELLVLEVAAPRAEVHPEALETLAVAVAHRAAALAAPQSNRRRKSRQ